MKTASIGNCLWAAISISIALCPTHAAAQARKPIDADKARVIEYWSKERRASAIPRDLVIDARGLGYLRHADGSLHPYGHGVAAEEAPRAQTPSPFAKPGDTAAPTISAMNPAAGATIGMPYTFSAAVKDRQSGVNSVVFWVQQGTAAPQPHAAAKAGGSNWAAPIDGLTSGSATWWVVAADNAGNSRSSGTVTFAVGAGGGGTVTNAEWSGGAVQTAAGRLYFEMPANARRTKWWGYVCSGTVAYDRRTSGRSVIVTAAHCVYDDANKAFARNVLFIPDQAHTSAAGTDRDCFNDPMGCWAPAFGVVDREWTTRTFPDNVAWDYAFYVVSDTGAHSGASAPSALDAAAGALPLGFDPPSADVSGSADYTHALGYSYSEDPKFMYCAEDMTTEGTVNWWLPSCALSGGSSGGPWVQPMNLSTGSGDIISVNSWGYSNSPGMAGPKLSGTSAACVFEQAKSRAFPTSPAPEGNAGEAVTCP